MLIFDGQLPVVTCDGCGVCCNEMGTPPFVRHEIYDLPPHLRDEVLQREIKEPDREGSMQPCYWLENGRCKHYEHRPATCRDFEVGCEACLSYRKYHGID